jgi:uncharacterized repeat protein (TIGR03803 family)
MKEKSMKYQNLPATSRISRALLATLAIAAAMFTMAPGASAQTETVLYSFAGGADGYNPVAPVAFDASGNLYGTTSEGGAFTNCSTGCGVVFELTPGSGGWTKSLPYDFLGSRDGSNPFVGLVRDAAGNLYGTTGNGGVSGKGTVFELSPNVGGGWTETVLHSFSGGNDGANPYGGLLIDASGNIYGTANGGANQTCVGGCGLVFKLSHTSGGWHGTALHVFTGGKDGSHPSGGLVFDAAGNLYGSATQGSKCEVPGCGLIFELTPTTSGGWHETVLHAFSGGSDGAYPGSALILDAAGNVYGTTPYGGDRTHCSGGCGVVFELSQNAGVWKETVLHTFLGTDGATSAGALTFDAAGNLYGTTIQGGNLNACGDGCGVVFKLSPAAGGAWTETLLHTFTGGSDGSLPQAGVILDSAGNLYGTAQVGGAHGFGAVFEITP